MVSRKLIITLPITLLHRLSSLLFFLFLLKMNQLGRNTWRALSYLQTIKESWCGSQNFGGVDLTNSKKFA